MVLLTMTTAIVAAVKEYNEKSKIRPDNIKVAESSPSLSDPAIGKPISHEQVLDIAKYLKTNKEEATSSISYHLGDLLRGSKVYTPPPKPKIEQVRRRNLMTFFLPTADLVWLDRRIQRPHGSAPSRGRSSHVRANDKSAVRLFNSCGACTVHTSFRSAPPGGG